MAPGPIDFFESVNLQFEVMLNDNQNGKCQTGRPALRKLSKPNKAFHTTVHLATKNLKGLQKSADVEIVSRIWSQFTTRSLNRVGDVGPSQAFQYWGNLCHIRPNEGSPPPSEVQPCFQAFSVIKNRDARCGGWQKFLSCLKTQGITANADIVPSKVVARSAP